VSKQLINFPGKLLLGREKECLLSNWFKPAVRTDRFSITGFVTFTAQGTVIKQNLQKKKLKQMQAVFIVSSIKMHNSKYTKCNFLCPAHNFQYKYNRVHIALIFRNIK
jgi:hypothetical protein